MVKGISKQVIVVQSPEEKLFEQAIFILNEKAVGTEGVTDEALLKEAKRLISGKRPGGRKLRCSGLLWALGGSTLTGVVWLITTMI